MPSHITGNKSLKPPSSGFAKPGSRSWPKNDQWIPSSDCRQQQCEFPPLTGGFLRIYGNIVSRPAGSVASGSSITTGGPANEIRMLLLVEPLNSTSPRLGFTHVFASFDSA